MIQKIIENGIYNTKIEQFIIDDENDVQLLPTNCAMGSIAFCIDNKTFYMIDSTGEWNSI